MHTDEIMLPLFEKDTDGSAMKKKVKFGNVQCREQVPN